MQRKFSILLGAQPNFKGKIQALTQGTEIYGQPNENGKGISDKS